MLQDVLKTIKGSGDLLLLTLHGSGVEIFVLRTCDSSFFFVVCLLNYL